MSEEKKGTVKIVDGRVVIDNVKIPAKPQKRWQMCECNQDEDCDQCHGKGGWFE